MSLQMTAKERETWWRASSSKFWSESAPQLERSISLAIFVEYGFTHFKPPDYEDNVAGAPVELGIEAERREELWSPKPWPADFPFNSRSFMNDP